MPRCLKAYCFNQICGVVSVSVLLGFSLKLVMPSIRHHDVLRLELLFAFLYLDGEVELVMDGSKIVSYLSRGLEIR